jgi:hypothetical protein
MTKKLIQTVDNTITNPSFLSLYPRIITVLVPIVGWSEFSEAYLQSIECNGIPLKLETNFGYVFSFFLQTGSRLFKLVYLLLQLSRDLVVCGTIL